jgi:hypothetical protein
MRSLPAVITAKLYVPVLKTDTERIRPHCRKAGGKAVACCFDSGYNENERKNTQCHDDNSNGCT